MIDLRKIDKDRPYIKFSEEDLKEFLEDIMIPKDSDKDRKIVIWCIDEGDGIAKNYEDTVQFKLALREEVKKRYPSIEE